MAQTPHPYGAPEEEERIEAALPEQARLGKLSLEVSMALIAGKTLPEMLTACTEAMVRYLDASFARIWLLNEEERVLELQASSGMYTHLGGGHARVPLGALKIGLIAAERRPYLTNEVQGDARIGDRAWAKREGMVAFAGYPLLVEERLIGVIAMFARHRLNDSDLQAMATVANGIALGVERSRMQKERERLLARERAARIEVEEAHQRLYDLVMQAPALICFLRGPQHVYELVNPLYLQLVGHRDIIGKPIREALPELAGQGFYELLDQVYASGTPFIGKEMRVAIDRYNDGMQEEAYFNFMYQPSRNAA
ncbi:MAG: GAF domain-containing protein, partial [Ktedonobacteraceae bacterium]